MNSFSIESIAQKKMWRGFALIAEKQLNSILISLFGRATICIIFSLQAFLLFFSLSPAALFFAIRDFAMLRVKGWRESANHKGLLLETESLKTKGRLHYVY